LNVIRKLLIASFLLASTPAISAPPAKFLHDAIKGDNSEVQLGRLIARRGHSMDVRAFGRTLVADHGRARMQAAIVSRRLGVRAPGGMTPDARREYWRLSSMRGLRFDREVRRYAIEDHRKDIAKFERQERSGDPVTARLAARTLPTLRKHLAMALALPRSA
jgi:putative membrane protein